MCLLMMLKRKKVTSNFIFFVDLQPLWNDVRQYLAMNYSQKSAKQKEVYFRCQKIIELDKIYPEWPYCDADCHS